MAGKNRLAKRKDNYTLLENGLKTVQQKSYQNLITAMGELNREIEEKSALSAEEFNNEKKQELLAAYKKCMDQITVLHDKLLQNGEINGIFGPLHCARKIMSKDMATLEKSRLGNTTQTLDEIFEASRSKTINLGKNIGSLDSAAGNQSLRIKLDLTTDEDEVKHGYFTKNTVAYDLNSEAGIVIEALDKISDKYDLNIDENSSFYHIANKAVGTCPAIRDMVDNDVAFNELISHKASSIRDNLKKIFTKFNMNDCLAYMDKLKNTDHVRAFVELMHLISKPEFAKSNYIALGVTSYEHVNKRNAAMSSVSELLGCSNIIAHAENVKVISETEFGPETLKGTFMEEIKGEDINKLTEKDKLYKGSFDFLSNSKGLTKQVANLQILDYLCGNGDRHRANMIYDVKDGKIVGIKGIDNDCCLGYKDHTRMAAGVKLENLKVIPKDTADKILALDEKTFRYMLYGYELTSIEAQAAVDRLNNLKQKIRESQKTYENSVMGKIVPGMPKVCDDEELDYLSMPYQLGMVKNSKGEYVPDDKSLFGMMVRDCLPNAGYKVAESNYRMHINKIYRKMVIDELPEFMTDLGAISDYKDASYKTLADNSLKLAKILKANESYAKYLGQTNPDGSFEASAMGLSPNFAKISELTKSGIKACDDLLEKLEKGQKSKNYEDRRKNITDLKNHYISIQEGYKNIVETVPKINRLYTERKDHIDEIRQINDRCKAEYENGIGRETRANQVRVNTNILIEPLEEKQAMLQYEIGELEKKIVAEQNAKEREKLVHKQDQMKLDRKLARLETEAACGIRELVTDPEGYSKSTEEEPVSDVKKLFERGLACGIIRYKIALSEKPKKDARTRDMLNKLADVDIDLNDYEGCIDKLMKSDNFKKTADAMSKVMKYDDIKLLSQNKPAETFEKAAVSYTGGLTKPPADKKL